MEFYLYEKTGDEIHIISFIGEGGSFKEELEMVGCYIHLTHVKLGKNHTIDDIDMVADKYIRYASDISEDEWDGIWDSIQREYRELNILNVNIKTPDGMYYSIYNQ